MVAWSSAQVAGRPRDFWARTRAARDYGPITPPALLLERMIDGLRASSVDTTGTG